MKTVHFRNPTNRPSRRCRMRRLFIPLVLVGFGLTPMVQAVGPDTDGAIPGSNNGEGIGVLVSRTSGVWNTGTGFEALNHLTAGNQNTATGLRALNSDTNGGFNTATGVLSLFSNTSGFYNTATGGYSLANNTATGNTATGYSALYYNTEGERNTATGFAALYKNTTGNNNTANGYQALFSNTTGTGNTASGYVALVNNSTGTGNTASGYVALANNSTGSDNTALGHLAGENVTTANNVIAIGAPGANVSNSCFIGEIFNRTASGGTAVFINSSGLLGTVTSSRRFKKEIKPMDSASEAILALKPVTFHYKSDAKGIPQFGLIAEEVAEINPDLVVRDENGEIYTVRYDAVNAMLLNEFLKEHRKMQEQEATIAGLKSRVAKQEATIAGQQAGMQAVTARLNEQAAQIQRVSAQIEVSKPARQVASLSAVVGLLPDEDGNNP
jgi:uncharacterized coiled-coil protein SlyX